MVPKLMPQTTSQEVVKLGCLLAVFVPFDTATVLLKQLTGVNHYATTVWNWVQSVGHKAMEHLEEELALLKSGIEPLEEKRERSAASGAVRPLCNKCP